MGNLHTHHHGSQSWRNMLSLLMDRLISVCLLEDIDECEKWTDMKEVLKKTYIEREG